MNEKTLAGTSKFLSYVLRHAPESIGIELDSDGWVSVGRLIEASVSSGHDLTHGLLLEIVASSDKKRFTISEDGSLIRAEQGHTTSAVSVKHESKIPPAVLYHGTATRFLDSILEQGLVAGARHQVHLSGDAETAREVGRRYGKPVILKVDAQRMALDGHDFFQAENGVWLAVGVSAEYLTVL
ncbi:RNA 2'-phosphotransferase [compost metagenome]